MSDAAPTLGLVGRGRAARSLHSALEQIGAAPRWWWSRGDAATPETLPAVEVVLLAVSDGAIEDAAARIADRPGAASEVWLHLSGSRPGVVCRVSPTVPRAAGAMHPVQALDGSAIPLAHLAGVTAGVDGDPEAVQAATALARRLGMTPKTIPDGSKALYHAAAVHVAGHATALFAQAQAMLAACGFDEVEARATLRPLMAGAVANLASGPPSAVVTGPIARGDAETIRAHIAALDAVDPGLTAAYRVQATTALELSAGALGRQKVAELADALGITPKPPPR